MPFFEPGQVIAGEYRVERLLGEGGMAWVFLCTDLGLQIPVAVKVLKEEYAVYPDVCQRFLQEARTQARLRHPHIMRVERVLQFERLVAMAMPYFPGESLADRLERAPGKVLPVNEALELFRQIVAAVRCAHEADPAVIHRDIKPDNIYLAQEEPNGAIRALLMDFGIAKVRQQSAVRTQTGAHMGTVAYMAPEQITATRDVTGAADIYSLGVVLFELLCGRLPFEADSDLLLPAAIVNTPVPHEPLRRLDPRLRVIVLRCLEKQPEQRYPSAAALEQAVAALGSNWTGAGPRPITPPPTGPERGTPGPPPPAPGSSATPPPNAAPASSESVRRSPARRLLLVLLLGLPLIALAALAGVFLLLLFRSSSEPTKTPTRTANTSQPSPVVDRPQPGRWGVTWRTVPGGRFEMGSEAAGAEPAELLVHPVTVPEFQLMQTEVTLTMYQSCVLAGRCSPLHTTDGSCYLPDWKRGPVPAAFLGPDQPVVCVSWHQAREFCDALGDGARLPSEAEWEYAARSAGRTRRHPWGETEADCTRAVVGHSRKCTEADPCGCGRNATAPVCSRPAGNSEQGLCDLAGNCWEWIEDCWHDSYAGAPADGSAWTDGCDQEEYLLRGGSWNFGPKATRTTGRGKSPPHRSYSHVGFRCARTSVTR